MDVPLVATFNRGRSIKNSCVPFAWNIIIVYIYGSTLSWHTEGLVINFKHSLTMRLKIWTDKYTNVCTVNFKHLSTINIVKRILYFRNGVTFVWIYFLKSYYTFWEKYEEHFSATPFPTPEENDVWVIFVYYNYKVRVLQIFEIKKKKFFENAVLQKL